MAILQIVREGKEPIQRFIDMEITLSKDSFFTDFTIFISQKANNPTRSLNNGMDLRFDGRSGLMIFINNA